MSNLSALEIVRMVGTEFSTEQDETIMQWINLQNPLVSQKKFGSDYERAVALLACHGMKMAGKGETSLGKVADSARLSSVSEGGVSVSFASSTASGGADAEYRLTSYGLQYLTLRNHHIIPIMIR